MMLLREVENEALIAAELLAHSKMLVGFILVENSMHFIAITIERNDAAPLTLSSKRTVVSGFQS